MRSKCIRFRHPSASELENKAFLKAKRSSESGISFADATSYLDGMRSPGQLDSESSAIIRRVIRIAHLYFARFNTKAMTWQENQKRLGPAKLVADKSSGCRRTSAQCSLQPTPDYQPQTSQGSKARQVINGGWVGYRVTAEEGLNQDCKLDEWEQGSAVLHGQARSCIAGPPH